VDENAMETDINLRESGKSIIFPIRRIQRLTKTKKGWTAKESETI